MARDFIVPGQIVSGSGALELAEKKFGSMGKKALLVTDSVMVGLGNCAKVETALKNQPIHNSKDQYCSRRTSNKQLRICHSKEQEHSSDHWKCHGNMKHCH